MNILITGGMGYIGSHTAAELQRLGHRIVIYDNLSNSHSRTLEKLVKIAEKDITFVQADILDAVNLEQAISSNSIDCVIHFAALKSVGDSVRDPLSYFANNVSGIITLVQVMQNLRIKKLVFSSSATVYGDPEYLPIDERHPTSPVNPYGHTKLFAEQILRDLVKSDPEWSVVCLRYFNPVGGHPSGLLGEDGKSVPNNLMPYICQVAAGELRELQIFGDDYQTRDGTGIRDYVHVVDLAEGHVAALGYLGTNPGCHFINLGTGKGFSVLELVSTFERVSRTKIPFRVTGRRKGDVEISYADTKKAKDLLNWSAKFDLDHMCESAWRFMVSRAKN